MADDQIEFVLLMKFGSEQNCLDLLNNGTVYMNTYQYFRDLETDEARGDEFEGSTEIRNFDFRTEEEVVAGIDGLFRVSKFPMENEGNIYSMYGIPPKEFRSKGFHRLSKEVRRFGDFAVVILEPVEFVLRLSKKFDELNLRGSYGYVQYLDTRKFNGRWSPFNKPAHLSYQNEFRAVVASRSENPLNIKLESLKSIAQIHTVEDLLRKKFALRD